MFETSPVSRRQFVQTAAAAAVTSSLLKGEAVGAAEPKYKLKGKLFKTLKIGMVQIKGSLTQKFAAAKAAGFKGIELNAPGFNIDEVKAAIDEVEFPVDGTVCSSHWQVRHTDPDPEARKKALQTLKDSIRVTHAVGGHTTLLVNGHGKDGTPDECWERSIENVRQALPLAAELGVVIAIENVWNHFLYDHSGDHKQTAEQYVQYVDELNSPWVGMQFDIGNHWKYGSMGDWIRTLGKRIVKLDVKGFSREEDKFKNIGEGDIDFTDVRKALTEINFIGWCAAEVGGGGLDRLNEISANMDREFALT